MDTNTETSLIGASNWKALVSAARELGINGKLFKGCRVKGTFSCTNEKIIEIAKSAGVEIFVHPKFVAGRGYVHALTGSNGWHKPIRFAP